MNREKFLQSLQSDVTWDVVIIGGGASGLGAAVEAASRGYTTLLLERDDFATGTSSRSTKLSHGGVRYLGQGNLKLVSSGLRERGLMISNAPHLVHPKMFIIPAYRWWEKYFYGSGLWLYEMLAGRLSLGHSRIISRAETIKRLPTIKSEGLRGGVIYYDGQFDDARYAMALAQTVADLGGTPLNYLGVTGFIKDKEKITGVTALDRETQRAFNIKARGVISATGVFTDEMRQQDDAGAKKMLAISRGTHIVVALKFLPGQDALMIPQTEDGRVLYLIPWHEHLLIGTTEVPVAEPSREPVATDEEIEFLLRQASKYLKTPITKKDILSTFSGLRPLVKASGAANTASLSRDYTIVTSASGLVSITGGKWTSYRHMGEDVINHLVAACHLNRSASRTKTLRLHGWLETTQQNQHGSDQKLIDHLMRAEPALAQTLHPLFPQYRYADVIWAVRHEMARTVEDVLARRTRILVLNAPVAAEVAPLVASLMAKELDKDNEWELMEVMKFRKLAKSYLPG